MLRNPISGALSNALRPPFGASGAAGSPLQQAVIAAWDMQEESGPLLPAKGGIEIPAFNSPGFTADGPASGIRARRALADSAQKFETATELARSAFDLRQAKTITGWFRSNSTRAGDVRWLFGGSSDQVSDANGQWSLRPGGSFWGFRIRQSDGTVRVAAQSTYTNNAWLFVAMSYDGISQGLLRTWNGSTLTESALTTTAQPNAPTASTKFDISAFGSGVNLDSSLLNVHEGVLTDAQLVEIYSDPRVFANL